MRSEMLVGVSVRLPTVSFRTAKSIQEGQTGVIALPNESHAAVKALVEYLYKAEYELPGHNQKPELPHKKSVEQDPLLHVSRDCGFICDMH